jgi:hypothetical protein
MNRTSTLSTVNHFLDRFVRPDVRLFRHALPAFQVCGYTGLALAFALGLGLAAARGLALWVIVVLLVTAACTFLTLAMRNLWIAGLWLDSFV